MHTVCQVVPLALMRYLTAPLSQLHRFAISFKSKCDGHTHRHVVMGVYCTNQFGALGLSRKRNLMDKRLQVKVCLSLRVYVPLLCVVFNRIAGGLYASVQLL